MCGRNPSSGIDEKEQYLFVKKKKKSINETNQIITLLIYYRYLA